MVNFKFKEYWNKLGVYQGIVLFLIVMFASNFFWKLTVHGDENGLEASFLCFDLSAVFASLCRHLAEVVHAIFNWLGITNYLYETTIYHPNGEGVRIVWGCNGIKQSFIFTMIMLFVVFPMSVIYLISAGLSVWGLSISYKLGQSKSNTYFIVMTFAPIITGVLNFFAFVWIM